jgi:two-component system, OmpR family, sensor kinase
VHLELDVRRPIALRGDPQRLRQLFFALMDNAVKYTDPGGKVTLALRVEPGGARVLVSDTGVGIPEKDLLLPGARGEAQA